MKIRSPQISQLTQISRKIPGIRAQKDRRDPKHHCLYGKVGPLVRPAVHSVARNPVGMFRHLRLAGTLWDSRPTSPLPRRTGTGLPAELEPLLICGTATCQSKENAKWVATENTASKLWKSANPRGFYPLWDGSVFFLVVLCWCPIHAGL